MQRLGGSSCDLAETQRPRLAFEGSAKNPSFRATRMREGRTKSQGNPWPPSRSVQRLGGSSCNLVETLRPRLALEGSANNPSFQTKRMREGHTKKTGELLITLSLRAEAQGLFL